MTNQHRPELTSDMTGAEFQRWYWLKSELVEFARAGGIRPTGSKEVLTARITAALDGVTLDEPATVRGGSERELIGSVTASTRIPVGQRCSQVVREWFVAQVGSSFRFDATMRRFFANTDGTQTMSDALDHFRASRGGEPRPIDSQFEFNRFTRQWHDANPGSPHAELLRAWQQYRSRPIDQRGRI